MVVIVRWGRLEVPASINIPFSFPYGGFFILRYVSPFKASIKVDWSTLFSFLLFAIVFEFIALLKGSLLHSSFQGVLWLQRHLTVSRRGRITLKTFDVFGIFFGYFFLQKCVTEIRKFISHILPLVSPFFFRILSLSPFRCLTLLPLPFPPTAH